MADYQITTGLPQLPSSGLDEKSFQLLAPVYQGMNGLARELSVQAGRVSYTQDEMANLNQLVSLSNYRQRLAILALTNIAYGARVQLTVSSDKIAGYAVSATSPFPRLTHAICDEPSGISFGNYGFVVFMSGYCPGFIAGTFMSGVWQNNDGVLQSAPIENTTQFLGYSLGGAGFYLSISGV